MVQWIDGSVPPDGIIELFHNPASAPRLVYQMTWYIKDPLLLIKKSSP